SVSRSILGEIFCKTTDDDLERAGRLIRPKVVVYRTPFRFRWNKRASQQREWQRMVKRLKFDPARNRLIGRIMGDQRGHSCLVSTDHTGHAHELAGYALANGWPNDRVHMLTGQQNKDERREIVKFAMEG